MSYCKDDIIVARATPAGPSALALIRVSGSSLNKLYKNLTNIKKIKPRYALNTKILHPVKQKVLDDAIVIFFASPSSFTGEDMIELSCHGSSIIIENIINAILDWGARLSLPGEFSYRAYINGKLDLLQAEAISALINAKTTLSADVYLKALDGGFNKTITNIKTSLINLLAILENELNFSENEIDQTTYKDINRKLIAIKGNVSSILSSSVFGKTLHTGIKTVLIGKPNAGKSSLFNALLGQKRSIVSKIKGTTRDYIESWIDLDGVPLCLIDTAGIHSSDNFLESLSIEQTKKTLLDTNIYIIIDENDPVAALKSLDINKNNHFLFVCSKSDLKKELPANPGVIYTSTKNNFGIDKLLTSLSTSVKSFSSYPEKIDGVIITQRQRNIMKRSMGSLNKCIKLVDSKVSTDIISSMIREFLNNLEGLYIVINEDEIINKIFKSFCVGK